MKARLIVLLLVFVTACSGATVAGFAAGRQADYQASPANPIAHGGCVIRFDTLSPSGASVLPRIYTNSSHIDVGCDSVAVDWGDSDRPVVLQTNGPSNIVDMTVDEDETFTARGFTCGGSGGPSGIVIKCYDRDGDYIPGYSTRLYGSGANLWISFDKFGAAVQ